MPRRVAPGYPQATDPRSDPASLLDRLLGPEGRAVLAELPAGPPGARGRAGAGGRGGDGLPGACADVRAPPLPRTRGVFVAPARRAGGRRLRGGDSRPPLD